MLELGLKVLASYLLGSVNGSLVLGRLTGRGDVRESGSGNAGGTNALRAFGWWFALGVVIIDIGKGVVPVIFLATWDMGVGDVTATVPQVWLTLACGAAAIAGHCYPVWFEFAGGKGAATAVGVLAVVAPYLIVPALIGWLAIVTTTGYVGLATVVAAIIIPLVVWFADMPGRPELLLFAVLLAAFVIFTHRENLRRLLKGTETRMTGLMLFGKRA